MNQLQINDVVIIDNIEYTIEKLLGKGKGGYSFLATSKNGNVTLKQIHHEPCEYYQFGNKIEAELNDYKRLSSINIPLPKLIAVDKEKEIIIKEYIDGPTIASLVEQHIDVSKFILQMEEMCKTLYANNLNIDYYPTNFIVQNDQIIYIDYECNNYDDKWNFENWGKKYW